MNIDGDITTFGVHLLSADCHSHIWYFKMRHHRPRAALRYNQA
jgi:hypothetical protein